MRRVLLLVISVFIQFLAQECFADYKADLPSVQTPVLNTSEDDNLSENNQNAEETKDVPLLPALFIWQLYDDEINSDNNITNYDEEYEEYENYDDTVAQQNYEDEDSENYVMEDGSVKLKGYLDFVDDSNAITLKDKDDDFVLNISVPQKFSGKGLSAFDKKAPPLAIERRLQSRYQDIEYNIAPFDKNAEYKYGPFSIGTSYNESIDTSDLGFTTSFYAKYENKYFALSSEYNKNSGVAYSRVIDKVSFAPELKLGKYMSIKDVMTSDITRNQSKNELILSIKPTKDDRVRFEFGAGQTFDEKNELLKSQVKFSTQVKW